MKKYVLCAVVLLWFACSGYEFVSPPEFVVDENGEGIFLSWKHAQGTDIAGYFIYWGEITHYRTTPPGNLGTVNGFDHMADAGYRTSYLFRLDPKKFYQFYMKSYDNRGNQSFASKVKYWPSDPNPKFVGPELMSDPWHGYLYKTGDAINLAWDMPDSSENVSYWETKAEYINDENMITTFQFGQTGVNAMTVYRPANFVGLFRFYVRACGALNNCSSWTSSDDAGGSIVSIDGL